MDEVTDRRLDNPDYDVSVHIIGVRIGLTGNVRWRISCDTDIGKEKLAEVLDRAAIVLRGEGE